MRAVGMLVVIAWALVAGAQPAYAEPPSWYPPLRWLPASPAN